MANDFGKDLGVVHEAVVTGRKVGAGKEFWATLAENEPLFRRFMAEAEECRLLKDDYEALVKEGFDPKTPIAEDLSGLLEFLNKLVEALPYHPVHFEKENDDTLRHECDKLIDLIQWDGYGGGVGLAEAVDFRLRSELRKSGLIYREVRAWNLFHQDSRYECYQALSTVKTRRARIVELFCKY